MNQLPPNKASSLSRLWDNLVAAAMIAGVLAAIVWAYLDELEEFGGAILAVIGITTLVVHKQ